MGPAITLPIKEKLDKLLIQSRQIRCPFFRRRAGDVIESIQVVINFLVSRHKSLDIMPCRSTGTKNRGQTLDEVMAIVREDITLRNYYISGRLTQAVYADNCFFDGPDPDMPVRSLQRYSDALHGLFDPSLSRYELLELKPRGPHTFTASWRLEGALKLPWRPKIKPYVGTTLYELDEDGLICSHTETWSVSALDAFASVLFADFGAEPAPPADELRQLLEAHPTQRDRAILAAHIPESPNPRTCNE